MKATLVLSLLLLMASPAHADLAQLLTELAPDGQEPGVAPLLWSIAEDDLFADEFLAAVDERQLVLSDTLITLLRRSEPQARPLFPDMYEISDFGPPPGERPPGWAELRWAGVRWMRRIVAFGPEGRDLRLREDLDRAMAAVDRPQRAEMGGIVLLLVDWWADRGTDPALTHHEPPRDPAADALAEATPPATDTRPHPGLQLLLAMDEDPVIGERMLNRLSATDDAWLVRDFMLAVEVDVDSLVALGVAPRRWDAEAGVSRGHSIPPLRRLALDALDAVAPPVVAGPDDLSRRVARLVWWDSARYEARYWSNPLQAPDFSHFLLGLRHAESDGGRALLTWVRFVYMQDAPMRERILEQLGPDQQGVVAELMGLAAMNRVQAAEYGFNMVYTRRPLIAAEGVHPVAVALDWEEVRRLIRRMLAVLTGVAPPRVLYGAPESLAAWWQDWWATARDDRRWYRGDLPAALELPDTPARPDLRPERGRVD